MIQESVYQAIYLDYLYDWIFDYSKNCFEKLNAEVNDDSMEKAGIKYKNFIRGMGAFAVILLLLLLAHLAYLMLKWLKKENALRSYLKQKLLYQAWIRYMIESNLKSLHRAAFFLRFMICFTCPIGIESSTAYIICLTAFSIWPFFLVRFLLKRRHLLEDEAFLKKYSAMVKGIKTKNPSSFLYNAFFSIRRVALVLCFVILFEGDQRISVLVLMVI